MLCSTTDWLFVFVFWRPKRIQLPEMLGSHSHWAVFTPGGVDGLFVSASYTLMSDWPLATCW